MKMNKRVRFFNHGFNSFQVWFTPHSGGRRSLNFSFFKWTLTMDFGWAKDVLADNPDLTRWG